MSARPTKLCRLCAANCSDFKSLLDGHSQGNLLYEMTYKYFHPTIVDFEVAKDVTNICKKCCDHMWNFHSFQISVRDAQQNFAHYPRGDRIKTEQELRGEIPNPSSVVKVEAESMSSHDEVTMDSDAFNEFIIIDDQPQTSSEYAISQENVVAQIKEEFIPLPMATTDTNKIENIIKTGISHADDVKTEKEEAKGFEPHALNAPDDDEYTEENPKMLNAKGITRCSSETESATSGKDISSVDCEYPKSQRIPNPHNRRARKEICPSDTESASSSNENPKTECIPNTHDRRGRPVICSSDTESVSSSDDFFNPTSLLSDIKKWQKSNIDLLAKWLPNIKCAACPKICQQLSRLVDHFNRHHPDDEFYIECCSRKLKKFYTIKQHFLFHRYPDIFTCNMCEKPYTSATGLKYHVTTAHPEIEKFVCKVCGELSNTCKDLEQHLAIVHNMATATRGNMQLVYTCHKCKHTSSTVKSLQDHMSEMHFRERVPFQCSHCCKSFVSSSAFREHLAGHRKKTLYVCAYCPQKCKWLADIYVHRQEAHPNESSTDFYTIVCTFDAEGVISDDTPTDSADVATKCHISLPELEIMDVNDDTEPSSTNNSAARKTATRLDNSSFACKMCDKGFKQRKGLQIHYSTIHKQPEKTQAKTDAVPEYSCRECESKFHKEFQLVMHIWDTHKARPELKCIICDKKYRSIPNLREHMAAHRNRDVYACLYCPQTFRRAADCFHHRQRKHAHKCEKRYFKLIPQAINYQSEPGDLWQAPTTLQTEADKQTILHSKKEQTTRISLRRHIVARHPVTDQPKKCHKTFAKKQLLTQNFNKYSKTKGYTCKHCGKKFTNYQMFSVHRRYKHTRTTVKHECSTCGKTFKYFKIYHDHLARYRH